MSEFIRNIKTEESDFIKGLINLSTNPDLITSIPEQVIELDDGGMRSIRFDLTKNKRRFQEIMDVEYLDTDKVLVLIELTVDEDGNLFDLDFFKTDFSKLCEYPTMDKVTKAAN